MNKRLGIIAHVLALTVGCAGQQNELRTAEPLTMEEARNLRLLTHLAALKELWRSDEGLMNASEGSSQGKAVAQCSKENAKETDVIKKAGAEWQAMMKESGADRCDQSRKVDGPLCVAKKLASKFCAREVRDVYDRINAALGEIVACADMKQGHSIVTHVRPQQGLKIRFRARKGTAPNAKVYYQVYGKTCSKEADCRWVITTDNYWRNKSELDGYYNEQGEIVVPEAKAKFLPGRDIEVDQDSGKALDVYSVIDGDPGKDPGMGGEEKIQVDPGWVKGWVPAKCAKVVDNFDVPAGAVKSDIVIFSKRTSCVEEQVFSPSVGLTKLDKLGIAFRMRDVSLAWPKTEDGKREGDRRIESCLVEAANGLSNGERAIFQNEQALSRPKGDPVFWIDRPTLTIKTKVALADGFNACLDRQIALKKNDK